MHIYEKEFDFVIQRALSLKRPARMVVAGADCENILKAVCKAEKQGFCRPILVGNGDKIRAMLEKLGLADRNYTISHVSDYEFNTDYSDCHVYMRRAIGIINDGLGDVLVRGNTSSRSFLMPILDKKNGLVTGLVSEVALVNPPYYDRVLALSDTSVLINPSEGQRKKIVKNLVDVLNHLGIERPRLSAQGFFILSKEQVIGLGQFHLMGQGIHDHSIPLIFRIKLCHTANAQKLLGLFQRCGKAKAQTQHPIPGRDSGSRENLVEIDFTGLRSFCQGSLGNSRVMKQLLKPLLKSGFLKLFPVILQKPLQIRSGCQFLV